MEGIVIKSTGSWYEVLQDNKKKVMARIVGRLRLDEVRSTNPIAVGDRVVLKFDNDYTIVEVKPRKNYVVRQSPRKKHQVHLIASNVDQALLIVTIIDPKLKQGFIDRFLLMTEPYDIPVIIAFNKLDLYGEEELRIYNEMKEIYENIGYQVLKCSTQEMQGIDTLKTMLKDKVTLISGQSGVGKSSLLNALDTNIDQSTSEISDFSGKGQHTTTFAELFELDFGGKIIDTPGIKTLAFNNFEVLDVVHNFREIFKFSEDCKFNNCTHRNEPKCAVKEAVESGQINNKRYNTYLNIIEEIENQNYWEVNSDI